MFENLISFHGCQLSQQNFRILKTRRQCKEYFEVIPLHCYTNVLIRFAINNPKLQNTPDTSDFLLANNIFHSNLCIYPLCIITSVLLYLIITSYHYINHWWFIHTYLLYIFYMMNAVRMWQEGNMHMQQGKGEGIYLNIAVFGVLVPL